MADYTVGGGAVVASTECNLRAGATMGYIGRYADIATVTETNGTITAITMVSGKVLYPVDGYYKNATNQAEYSTSTGLYDAAITNIRSLGRDSETTLNISRWVNECRLVFFPVGADGVAEAYGLEVIGTTKTISIEPGKITRHLKTAGTRGDENGQARNEFDFSAQHDYAPLNVTASILPALTTP